MPPSEYQRMRAPFQAGDFPAPIKYGYASVGRIERGPRELKDRTVFVPISVDPDLGHRGQLDQRRLRWERHIYEKLLTSIDFRKELNRLVEQKEHQQALELAQTGLAGTDAAIADFAAELVQLRTELAKADHQPALRRTPARRNFCGSTASPSIRVS